MEVAALFSPVMPVRVPWKACIPFVRRSGVECKWRPPPSTMYSEHVRELRGSQHNEFTLKHLRENVRR